MRDVHMNSVLLLVALATVVSASATGGSGRMDVRGGERQSTDANLGPLADSMMQIGRPEPAEQRSILSNFVLSRVDDPEMESDARMAAWIAPDGQMMIPPKSRRPISHANDVPEDLLRAGLSDDSLVSGAVRESLSRGSGAQHRPAQCTSCGYGIMSPYITYSNGSDIFLHDIYSPVPSELNISSSGGEACSQTSQYPGCFFTDFPKCKEMMVCSNTSFNITAILPKELISFEINETEATMLLAGTFEGLSVLSMKLVDNKIRFVFPDAFLGTRDLMYLSLELNLIRYVQFELAFRGLDSLIVLLLKDNQLNFTNVGTEMPQNEPVLPSLVYLNLANNPLGALNQYAFASLRNSSLEDLNLQSCKLRFIHPGAFEWLPGLVHVDLYDNPDLLTLMLKPSLEPFYIPPLRQLGLGVNQLQTVPFALLNSVNRTLTTLNLSGNFFVRLTSSFLPTLAKVSTLILENCGIISLAVGTFDGLPNLQYLYLGKNQLTEIASNVLPPGIVLLSIRQNPSKLYGPDPAFRLSNGNLSGMKQLMWLDMNDMNLETVSETALDGLTQLRALQMRNSGITQIAASAFRSLSRLIMLDLGENRDVQTLPQRFSEGLQNLTILFLDHCSINFPEDPPDGEPESPFSHLTSLTMMFLTDNNIHHFYGQLIANNSKLNILDLSYNRMSTWNRHTARFMAANDSRLSISNNRITYLPDNIADEFSSFKAVDLSDNALICTCQVKDLLQLASSNSTELIRWDDIDAYKCTDTFTSIPVVRRIQSMTEEHFYCDRQPQPSTEKNDEGPPQEDSAASYIAGAVCAVVLVGVASGCFLKRRQLAHAWYTYRHQMEPSKKLVDDPVASYEYDAFISFNATDRQWVYDHLVTQLEGSTGERPDEALNEKDGHSSRPTFRLCVHDRDFTPGRMITENIVSNIFKSRHVVVVLSKAYCESKWCRYELNLAHHQLLDENRNTLVLILLEDVPKSSQYASLRYVMRTRTYLVWSSDIEGQKLFWRRLKAVLTGQESARPS